MPAAARRVPATAAAAELRRDTLALTEQFDGAGGDARFDDDLGRGRCSSSAFGRCDPRPCILLVSRPLKDLSDRCPTHGLVLE
jgi:hypothetical protein